MHETGWTTRIRIQSRWPIVYPLDEKPRATKWVTGGNRRIIQKNDPMLSCHECQKVCDEGLGRQVIVGQNNDGFDWIFLCLDCVRDWRQRGLKSEGYSPKAIEDILNKEYPMS